MECHRSWAPRWRRSQWRCLLRWDPGELLRASAGAETAIPVSQRKIAAAAALRTAVTNGDGVEGGGHGEEASRDVGPEWTLRESRWRWLW